MKKLTILTTIVLALSGCNGTSNTQAQAATPKAAASSQVAIQNTNVVAKDVPENVVKDITRTLERNYADQKIKIVSISQTPMQGVYEVLFNGKQIAYANANADFIILGEMLETKTGKSLTEERIAELSRVDFNQLPFDKAIKEVRGNGALKVAVFTDADCPYCKRLETEFAKMNNITIYNFMMPIASLHPDAKRKSEQIWCQPDRLKAWTMWMREGKMPKSVPVCKNPVAETTALGETLGFTGTPTLVYPNGQVQSGYTPLPALEQIIKQNQK